jgi:hypothetical protein
LEYSTMCVQNTTRNPWNTLKCLYKVPQGIPGANLTNNHVYIRYPRNPWSSY